MGKEEDRSQGQEANDASHGCLESAWLHVVVQRQELCRAARAMKE
jgi:hypothetical protein